MNGPAAIEPHIGTLNEGSLHAALKDWIAEPGDRFEVPLEGFVIDIVREGLLIEIQTGSFGAMGRKLDVLLADHRIRIVHPLAAGRWIEQPGKKRRKSPKRETLWSVFGELVSIPTLIDHPNLEVQVVLVHETQHRSGTDMVARGRRGRVTDRQLEEVVADHLLANSGDLLALLPAGLPAVWTTADLAAGARIPRNRAQQVAYVLRALELVTVTDRTRAGYHYKTA